MLKNYTSSVPVQRTLNNIQAILAKHGAGQISFEYAEGVAVGIAFSITTGQGLRWIKLPARIEKVPYAMYGRGVHNEREKEQVYRTAWKNIHDWIDAQMALVQTDMVKLEEVFLPYMTDQKGQTFFEAMENNGFLLPSGS